MSKMCSLFMIHGDWSHPSVHIYMEKKEDVRLLKCAISRMCPLFIITFWMNSLDMDICPASACIQIEMDSLIISPVRECFKSELNLRISVTNENAVTRYTRLKVTVRM